MIRRRYISTRLLERGMVIDQSIIDGTGRVLVARKTPLDDYIIQGLRKLKITGVYIREGEEEPLSPDIEVSPETLQTIEKLKKADRTKMQLSESVKARVATGMQFMFNNPKDAGFMDAARSISGELMKTITENDAVAVNIDALKVSDEYTFKHCVDVASIAMIIARQSGMSEKEVNQIGISGLLHDLGKSEIPSEILNKPSRLTDEEFEVMKSHPARGYNLLKDKPDIAPEILMGVLQHHEKMGAMVILWRFPLPKSALMRKSLRWRTSMTRLSRSAPIKGIFTTGCGGDDYGYDRGFGCKCYKNVFKKCNSLSGRFRCNLKQRRGGQGCGEQYRLSYKTQGGNAAGW